jgi:hypothetical protein
VLSFKAGSMSRFVGRFQGKRTFARRIYEFTPFCNGPDEVKSPELIVTPLGSRFCPWSTLRPPHDAIRGNGELDRRGPSDDGHWACSGFTSSTVPATGLRALSGDSHVNSSLRARPITASSHLECKFATL